MITRKKKRALGEPRPLRLTRSRALHDNDTVIHPSQGLESRNLAGLPRAQAGQRHAVPSIGRESRPVIELARRGHHHLCLTRGRSSQSTDDEKKPGVGSGEKCRRTNFPASTRGSRFQSSFRLIRRLVCGGGVAVPTFVFISFFLWFLRRGSSVFFGGIATSVMWVFSCHLRALVTRVSL